MGTELTYGSSGLFPLHRALPKAGPTLSQLCIARSYWAGAARPALAQPSTQEGPACPLQLWNIQSVWLSKYPRRQPGLGQVQKEAHHLGHKIQTQKLVIHHPGRHLTVEQEQPCTQQAPGAHWDKNC